MTWIHKPELIIRHECKPPTTKKMVRPPRVNPKVSQPPASPVGPPIPDGPVGAVWLCGECKTLWIVKNVLVNKSMTKYQQLALEPTWAKAGWLTRHKYRRYLR